MTRRGSWISALVVLIDLLVLLMAIAGSLRLWLWWMPQLERVVQVALWEVLFTNQWLPPGMLLIAAWLGILGQLGYYDPSRGFNAVRSLQVLSRAVVGTLAVVVLVQFFIQDRVYSRLLTGFFLGFGFLGLGLWRWVLLRVLRRVDWVVSREKVAIFGVSSEAELMAQRLRREGRAAFQLVGHLAPRGEEEVLIPPDQILGGIDELRALALDHRLDTLVLATTALRREEALELATRCRVLGLRVLQVPFTWGFVSPRLDFAELGNLQLIDIGHLAYSGFARRFKRIFDLVAVTVAGVLLSPIFLCAALAVRLSSPGPILYTSPRVGLGGRSFPFYKFRSMVQGAEQEKERLRAQNEADGPLFKMTDDPRVTAVGRFIRKWSIDELPQFWNVIRGDMNLVGPRPLPLADLSGVEHDPEARYWFELRHQVPPGITGLWQVMGRSNLGFREMIQHDIYYVQNWSFWLDLKILLLTVPAVLRGRGAR